MRKGSTVLRAYVQHEPGLPCKMYTTTKPTGWCGRRPATIPGALVEEVDDAQQVRGVQGQTNFLAYPSGYKTGHGGCVYCHGRTIT